MCSSSTTVLYNVSQCPHIKRNPKISESDVHFVNVSRMSWQHCRNHDWIIYQTHYLKDERASWVSFMALKPDQWLRIGCLFRRFFCFFTSTAQCHWNAVECILIWIFYVLKNYTQTSLLNFISDLSILIFTLPMEGIRSVNLTLIF